MASDSSMCPGVDSASKNEYQDNHGGKGGRCVRLTTYQLHVPIVKKAGGLNLLEPCGPVLACNVAALQRNSGRENSAEDVHECQQKSIGLKFSKSQTGNDVRYSCHHNSSRFTFPIFAHSCRFSVLHSLQSITPRIY